MKVLGISWAHRRVGESQLGYCLIDTRKTKGRKVKQGEQPIEGDPAEAALSLAKAQGVEEVTLTTYATAASFHGSRAHRDGLTLEEHRELIDRTARLLRDNGIRVDLENKQ